MTPAEKGKPAMRQNVLEPFKLKAATSCMRVVLRPRYVGDVTSEGIKVETS